MKCSKCPNEIEPARVELNLKICFKCAEKTVQKYKGDNIFTHKTGSVIQVMSAETHSNYRRYVPYGKNTGRGSGVHKVSRPVTSLKIIL